MIRSAKGSEEHLIFWTPVWLVASLSGEATNFLQAGLGRKAPSADLRDLLC